VKFDESTADRSSAELLGVRGAGNFAGLHIRVRMFTVKVDSWGGRGREIYISLIGRDILVGREVRSTRWGPSHLTSRDSRSRRWECLFRSPREIGAHLIMGLQRVVGGGGRGLRRYRRTGFGSVTHLPESVPVRDEVEFLLV